MATLKELWLGDMFPGIFVKDPAHVKNWGVSIPHGNTKFCLHTTEGPQGLYWPGQGSYYGHQWWPHGTVFIYHGSWAFAQHIPLPFSAKALANKPGGVETNKLGIVFQVEVACRAQGVTALPPDALGVIAKIAVWLHRVAGLPLECSVAFKQYPASYGVSNGVRLSAKAWERYSGILGHQHVPENDHGDPGNFPIGALMGEISKLTRPGDGGEMLPQDMEKLAKYLSSDDAEAVYFRVKMAQSFLLSLREQVFDTIPPIKQGNAGNVIGATYNKVGNVQTNLKELRDMVAMLANNQQILMDAINALAADQNQISLTLGEIKANLIGEHTPPRPYEVGGTETKVWEKE